MLPEDRENQYQPFSLPSEHMGISTLYSLHRRDSGIRTEGQAQLLPGSSHPSVSPTEQPAPENPPQLDSNKIGLCALHPQ